MIKEIVALSGIVLDEEASFNLCELCRLCDVSADYVIEMIEEGVLAPTGRVSKDWIFCGLDVRRVQIAVRLQQDLRVNLPGAALALELLEELEILRRMQQE